MKITITRLRDNYIIPEDKYNVKTGVFNSVEINMV